MEIDSVSGESKKPPDVSIADDSECMASEESVTNGPTSIVSALPSPLPMSDTQFDPPPPLFTRSGRPRREYRLPKRFRDNLPEPPAPATTTPQSVSDPDPPVRRVLLIVRDRLITLMNSFGVWRDYPERPSVDPDSLLNLDDLSTAHRPNNFISHVMPSDSQAPELAPSHWPFSNATVHGVMQWLNNGNTAKSEVETTKLIHDVILSPNFDAVDLAGFDAHRENQRLDKALSQSTL